MRKADFAMLVCLVALTAAQAQTAPLCAEAADPEDAGVVLLRCGGVDVAAEAEAVRSPVNLMSRHPHAIQLDAGAIAASAASAFTIQAPDAVISGSGSDWVIVVESGRALTAVLRGTVTAYRRADGSERTLRADVAPPDAIEPKRLERLSRALYRVKQKP